MKLIRKPVATPGADLSEIAAKRDATVAVLPLLEQVVQLVGHKVGNIGGQEVGVVYDAGLLIRDEVVRHKQCDELFLHLVIGAERALYS